MRRQVKELDLKGRNGVTLTLNFLNPVKPEQVAGTVNGSPFYLQIREPYEDVVYYERYVDKPQVNINLPKHGDKVHLVTIGEAELSQHMVTDLKKPFIPHSKAPKTERPYKLKDMMLVPNDNLQGPARMFTKYPVIEYNPRILGQHNEAIRTFILLHEMGHVFFDDETEADRWATIEYLNQGYNLSSALYALTCVLGKNRANVDRMVEQDKFLSSVSKMYYN